MGLEMAIYKENSQVVQIIIGGISKKWGATIIMGDNKKNGE